MIFYFQLQKKGLLEGNMAQSRFEKIGTIYSRITGLYKSGAIKAEQVPLWVPIYEAFPPLYEPRWDRKPEEKTIVKVLYHEDKVRAQYYKKFGDWEMVNLFDNKKPTSQLFVDKYLALSKSGDFSEQELWERTVSELENEGIELKGNNQNQSTSDSASADDQKKLSFKDLLNSP